jgi:hypothetical protein
MLCHLGTSYATVRRAWFDEARLPIQGEADFSLLGI